MMTNEILVLMFLVISVYLICFTQPYQTRTEGFFGGYHYPYDYPYYWPYFYSGCNQTMFGDVKCHPLSNHPFW